MLNEALTHVIKCYKKVYALVDSLSVAAGALMTPEIAIVSNARVTGYEVVIGFSLGLILFHRLIPGEEAMPWVTLNSRLEESALIKRYSSRPPT